MHVLAANLSRMNKLDEARLLHEELVTLKARVYGPEDIATLATMSNLASLYARAGEPEKAKQKYEQVFAILDRDHPDHPNTIRVMRALADIYSRSGQAERAIDLIRRSAYAAARVMGTSHPDTQAYIGSAIGVDLASGSRDALERSLTVQGQSLDQARHDFGEASKEASRWTFRQAETLVLLDRCDDAMALLQGLPVDREPLDISGVRAQTRLAVLLRNQRRLPEAQQLLHRSHEATTRLRRETPQPNQEIEQLHSFAGFLLERWPGHSPGVDRSEWPPSPLTIDVPFRATSPVADGRIEPAEYGPGLEVTFDDDANPGRLYSWMKAHPKTPDDLSVRMHVAYTKRSLFLAFRVRDQYVDAGGSATAPPWENDSIDVVIDGDCVANDQLAIIRFDDTGPPENSEGFQVEADAGGRKLTGSASFSNADWKAGTSRTADGYIIEFEVPLVLIDTRDGPEYDPVAAGDEIRFNFGICDQDDQDRYQQAYGTFWAEDPGLSPTWGGEDFWTVRLRLVPNHVPGIPSQNDQPKPSDHDDPIPTRVGPPRREDE
jgi:hypothetical protein